MSPSTRQGGQSRGSRSRSPRPSPRERASAPPRPPWSRSPALTSALEGWGLDRWRPSRGSRRGGEARPREPFGHRRDDLGHGRRHPLQEGRGAPPRGARARPVTLAGGLLGEEEEHGQADQQGGGDEGDLPVALREPLRERDPRLGPLRRRPREGRRRVPRAPHDLQPRRPRPRGRLEQEARRARRPVPELWGASGRSSPAPEAEGASWPSRPRRQRRRARSRRSSTKRGYDTFFTKIPAAGARAWTE